MGKKNRKKILAVLLAVMMVLSVCSPASGGSGVGNTSAQGSTEAEATEAASEEATEAGTETAAEEAATGAAESSTEEIETGTESTSEEEASTGTETATEAAEAGTTAEGSTESSTEYETQSVTEAASKNLLGAAKSASEGNENGISLTAGNSTPKALSDYITSISIGTLNADGQSYSTAENGTYVGSGDSIQITINYSVNAGELSNDNNVVTYTLPDTISVTEEQSGYVYSDGNVVGTYTIDTNGNVTITFYTNSQYLTLSESFSGYITFECEANLTGTGSSSEIEFTGSSGTISTGITVVEGEDDSDISTLKSATSEVKNDDGSYTITYSVKVSTTKGTRGTVSLTDTLTLNGMTGVSYDSSSVTVTKGDSSSSVSGYSTSIVDGTTLSITDLPQLEANEYYTITYSVTVSSETYTALNGTSGFTNKATSTSTDEGNLYTDSESSSVYKTVTHSMVTKSSSTSGNTVTWTIVVNAAGDNLNGYTLSDVLGSSLTSSDISNYSVSVTTSGSGTDHSSYITANALFGEGYMFAEDDYNTYTITYSYTSTDTVRESNTTIDNDVYLKNNVTTYTAEGNGVLYATAHLSKKYSSATNEGTDDAAYTWTLTLSASSDDKIPSGSTVKDTLGDYMTITKTNASSFSASEAISATITFYDSNNNSLGTLSFSNGTSGTLNWTGAEDAEATYFVILFTSDVTSDVTITYSATPTYDNMEVNETRIFKNTAQLTVNSETEKEVNATRNYTYKEVIEKKIYASTTESGWTQETWAASPSDTTYGDEVYPTSKDTGSSSYSFTTYAGDGVYFYYILVNADGSLNNTDSDVVINDTITNGTYVSGSAALVNDISWYYAVNTTYTLTTETTSNGIKFTIPYSAFVTSGSSAVQYYIIYAVQVSESDDTVTLSNTASVDGDTGETSVSIKVEPETNTGSEDVLSKTAVQGSDGNGVTADVTYTVNVNLSSKDLLEGYDTLTLYDEMEVPASGLANVSLSDVKVYTADESGNKTGELSGGWSYTFDKDTSGSSSWFYYITFVVPDETALIIEYVYTYEYDKDSTGSRTIVNSVTIQGTEYAVSKEEGYTVASSSAGTNNGSTVTVYKVDSSNYSTYLSGAVFDFDYYDTSSGGWADVSDNKTVTIDESVKFTTNQSASSGIVVSTNTLYRLTEQTAPTGYGDGDTVVYMIFADSNTSVSGLKSSWSTLLNTLGIDADSVSYYADGVSGYQEQIPNTATGTIYITKNWVDENGATVTPSVDSVDVTLYETAMTKIDTKTVTVQVVSQNGQQVKETYDVKPNTDMTLTFSIAVYSGANITSFTNNDVDVKKSLSQSADYTVDLPKYEYTFEVTENTTIVLTEGNYYSNSSSKTYYSVSASYTAGYYTTGTNSASAVSVAETSTSGVYTKDSGSNTTITLSSANNWTAMVTNLDINALYSVIENTNLSGYTVSYSSDVSLTEATDLSAATYSGSIVVTNTENSNTTGKLTVTKTLAGDISNLSDAGNISITVTGTNPISYSKTISKQDLIDGNGSVTLSGLEVGTYTVTETATALSGYTMSTSYSVTTTDTSGSTSTGTAAGASASVTAGNTTTVEFTNTYTSTGATIKVSKSYTTGSTVKAVKFGVYYKVDSSGTDTVTIDGSYYKLYNTVEMTADNLSSGSYTASCAVDTSVATTYYVYELDSSGNPITSSGTMFKLDSTDTYYTVTSSDNTSINLSQGGTAAASFTNTQVADTSISLSATKTLTDKANQNVTLSGGEFAFVLLEETGTNAYSTVKVKTNTSTGEVSFTDISYTAADIGTHTYYIYEISDSSDTNLSGTGVTINDNYTYDESAYKVVVTVSNDNGTLKTSTEVTKYASLDDAKNGTGGSSSSTANIAFANTDNSGAITVTKSFAGTDAQDVIFALYSVSGGTETLVETKTLSSTSSTRYVTFDVNTENTYRVYELTSTASSYKYGDGDTITIGSTTYYVAVSGNVSGTDNDITFSSETTKSVTFTNTAATSISLEKEIAGSAASASDEFEFTIYLGGSDLLTTNADAYGYEKYTVGGSTSSTGSLTLSSDTGTNSTDYPYYVTVTLKGSGGYTITGLPAGTTYSIVENDYSGDGYTSQCTTGNSENTSGLSAGSAATVKFTNTKTAGSLKVSKTVSGTGGSVTSFEFTVTLTGNIDTSTSYTVVKTSTTRPTATGSWVSNGTNSYYDSSNSSHTYTLSSEVYTETTSITFTSSGSAYTATFTLADGETFEIDGLPAGTTYAVVETDYTSSGYRTTVSGDTGSITDGSTAEAAFTNTVIAKGSLSISKELSGNDTSDYTDTEFEVTVYLKDSGSSLSTTTNYTVKKTTTSGTTENTVNLSTNNTGNYTDYGYLYTFSLKDGETLEIDGLPVGTGYTVVESTTSASDFDVSYIYTTTGYSGTISDTTAHTVTIVNTRNTYGNLAISKTITGNAALNYTDRKYTFTITLSDTGISGNYDCTYVGSKSSTISVTFSSGIATVTLKAGESITIKGLPNGVTYKVTETDAEGYGDYTTSATVNSEDAGSTTSTADLTVTGTIVGDTNQTTTQEVAFINNIDKDGSLTINKVIDGNDTDSSKKFTFTITLSNVSDSDLNKAYTATSTGGASITSVTFNASGVATVELAGGQSVTITGLPNGAAYTVEETSYMADGYTTAITSQTGTKDGDYKVSGTISSSSPQSVEYTNTKNTYGDLLIGKTVENNGSTVSTSASAAFTFTIELTGTTDTNILNGQYTATSTGGAGYSSIQFSSGTATIILKSGQTVTISNIPNGVGYTVTETTADGYVTTYSTDGSSYTTTGNVVSGTIDGGNGTSGGNTQYYAEFKNTVITQSLSVSKVLDGNDVSTDNYFEFVITLKDAGSNPISGTYDGVTFTSGTATIYVNGGSTKTITGLPINAAYTVTETTNKVFTLSGGSYVENTNADAYTLTEINGTAVTSETSASGTITDSAGSVAAFTNTRNSYGTLTVEKSVSSGDTARKFDFTIKLTNTTDSSVLNGSYAMTSNVSDYDGASLQFSGGTAEISLADGEYVTISGLPNGVNYTVTEVNYTSDGYITSSVGTAAAVVGGEDYTAAFTNKLTSVSISKVDVADGCELPGATIQIIDSSGTVVDEWVSTDVTHTITGLIPGETYTLRETVAPTGYDIATDTTFYIDKYGNVVTTATVTADGIILIEDALIEDEDEEDDEEITETTTETTTETKTTSTDSEAPDTGDSTPIAPIAVLFGMSIAGIFMTALVKSKKKKRRRK